MGWQSTLLGSNVVSSYQHIDNLRNDLTAGKFWDSGETKYTQVRHDGTRGVLESSAGDLVIKRAGATMITVAATHAACEGDFVAQNGKSLLAYDAQNTSYAQLYHDGTKAVFAATAGRTQIAGNANEHAQIGAGAAQSRIYMYDAALAAWRYLCVNNGAVQVGT
jgi:hypothetical protein